VPVVTAELSSRLETWNRNDAKTRVAIGQLLAEVKAQMPHGEWLAWLDREMPFSARSAQLFMEIADWAAANPARFDQLAPLGPSKLYVLFKMAAAPLGALLKRARHLVPSSQLLLPLKALTFQQFLEILAAEKQKEKPTAEEAANAYAEKLIKKSKSEVNTVRQAIMTMIAHREILPEDDVVDMYDTLHEALGWLANAFAIPD
jgi:hypothetical protein